MQSMVTVAIFDTLPKADLAKSLLESEGIQAVITDGNTVAMDWLLNNAIGGIKLQVSPSDVDRARSILDARLAVRTASAERTNTLIRFKCSECHRPVEFPVWRAGGVESCPHCKSYLDVPERCTGSEWTESIPSPDVGEGNAIEPATATGMAPIPPAGASIPWWFEMLAVLCLGWMTSISDPIITSVFAIKISEVADLLYVMFDSVQAVAALILILALSRDSWSTFGIVRPVWTLDALLSLGIWTLLWFTFLFVQSMNATTFAYRLVGNANSVGASDGPISWPLLSLFALSYLTQCLATELVLRGYLIPRLERLTHSSAVAVLVSSALSAGIYLSSSFEYATYAFAYGLVYSMSFCVTRRLWPIVFAHAALNLSFRLAS